MKSHEMKILTNQELIGYRLIEGKSAFFCVTGTSHSFAELEIFLLQQQGMAMKYGTAKRSIQLMKPWQLEDPFTQKTLEPLALRFFSGWDIRFTPVKDDFRVFHDEVTLSIDCGLQIFDDLIEICQHRQNDQLHGNALHHPNGALLFPPLGDWLAIE